MLSFCINLFKTGNPIIDIEVDMHLALLVLDELHTGNSLHCCYFHEQTECISEERNATCREGLADYLYQPIVYAVLGVLVICINSYSFIHIKKSQTANEKIFILYSLSSSNLLKGMVLVIEAGCMLLNIGTKELSIIRWKKGALCWIISIMFIWSTMVSQFCITLLDVCHIVVTLYALSKFKLSLNSSILAIVIAAFITLTYSIAWTTIYQIYSTMPNSCLPFKSTGKYKYNMIMFSSTYSLSIFLLVCVSMALNTIIIKFLMRQTLIRSTRTTNNKKTAAANLMIIIWNRPLVA